MLKEFLKDGETRMGKAVESLDHDLRAIRTGRANPALLERLTIDYYGVTTPVNQVAGISAPEARMLMIKPWDASALKAIERSILESDLGLNPNNDGQVIRLILPQLTRERREDLVKQVGKRAEEARVAVRNIRRDVMKDLEEAQKEAMLTEDDLHWGKEQVQKLTDRFVHEVDEHAREKEEEILEF
ncbi:MAG: ribosome recycling factor [Anaerolineales bacterium]|nr:ribosome recycling factor [Anaerolineales bacterium]MCB9128345.1 ribosome recycling factor [Ardenticatenales bacterium]MCB9172157.1 ribosome recycling factor [Ardenticatenales bacterium]